MPDTYGPDFALKRGGNKMLSIKRSTYRLRALGVIVMFLPWFLWRSLTCTNTGLQAQAREQLHSAQSQTPNHS